MPQNNLGEGKVTDLFDKRSDRERLYEWIKSRNWSRTSDVIKWGADNYSNRALRNAQDLCAKGLIRRMSKEECQQLFGKTKELAWEPVGN